MQAVSVAPPTRLTLSPNPASLVVTVAGVAAGAWVEVFDARSRRVATATAEVSGPTLLVLPAGLAAGIYVVRCGAQAGRLAVEPGNYRVAERAFGS